MEFFGKDIGVKGNGLNPGVTKDYIKKKKCIIISSPDSLISFGILTSVTRGYYYFLIIRVANF